MAVIAAVAALGIAGCSDEGESASSRSRSRQACATLQHALDLYQTGVKGKPLQEAFRNAITDADRAADQTLRDAIVAAAKMNLPGGAPSRTGEDPAYIVETCANLGIEMPGVA
jgi:hypothetical protein